MPLSINSAEGFKPHLFSPRVAGEEEERRLIKHSDHAGLRQP